MVRAPLDPAAALVAGRFPRGVAVVNLDAIAANVRALLREVGPATRLMPVVKANAYGHGAVPVSIAALRAGASALAVACLDEGIQLRRAGVAAPILLLGPTPPEEMDRAVHCLRNLSAFYHKHCVEVNRLENEADRLLRDQLAALFEGKVDPIEVIKWKELYETMESVTDRCEDVVNVIEGIVLKMA